MSDRIKEFTTSNGLPEFPGGRFREDGPGNGQAFREDHLAPALVDEDNYDRIRVVFDGAPGFGTSFLEEAFGGLVREHGMTPEFLARRLNIVSNDDDLKMYVSRAKQYIK